MHIASEDSPKFHERMRQAMTVSYHKYGPVKDAYPHKVNAIASLEKRLQLYKETGNADYLVDVANFCLGASVNVLMGDLSLKQLGSIQVGDRILAFSESPEIRRSQRKWKPAEVTHATRLDLPCCRVTTEQGKQIIASNDHRWLVCNLSSRKTGFMYRWCETGHNGRSGLRNHFTHRLPIIFPTQVEVKSYQAGYVSGILDGEGNLGQNGAKHGTLKVSWAQNEGPVEEKMASFVTDLGFELSSYTRINPNADLKIRGILGGMTESARLLMMTRPVRLLRNLNLTRLGSVRQIGIDTVMEVEPIGKHEVVAIQTTTGTFVADGFGHHNCMIEFMHPAHPDFHDDPTDGGEGRYWFSGGRATERRNDGERN